MTSGTLSIYLTSMYIIDPREKLQYLYMHKSDK